MPVYMIRAGENGPVKVGFSDDPFGRLSNLQVSHWEKLRIIRLFEGGEAEEVALHNHFADLLIRGEWFSFSRAMLADVGLVDMPLPSKPEVVLQYPLTAGQERLLADVDAFLKSTGMGATYLGVAAVNDGKFVSRLRAGKNMQTSTIQRVIAFMAERSQAAA